MKISIGQDFKHIIYALNEIINDNLIFECKKSGLYCMAPDDATVCLIEVFIHKDTMSLYEIDNNVGQLVSLDMNLLYKIMKTIKYDTLHLETTNQNTLMISSEGERKCKFELPLLDTMKEDMVIPEIDYDCIFTINKSNFQGVCKDLKQFGQEIVLKVDNNKVFFSTKDEIECNIELDNVQIENEDNDCIQKKYDLQYFLKMLKATSLSSDVSFYFSKNMPLVVEYKMPDGESYIRYYLGNMI